MCLMSALVEHRTLINGNCVGCLAGGCFPAVIHIQIGFFYIISFLLLLHNLVVIKQCKILQ